MPERYGVASAPFGTTSAQHSFAVIPDGLLPRSSFNRSCGLKTSFNSGFLVPIFVDEVLPGDTFNLKMNTFIRMSTPLHPVMDNIWADFFFFFVPNRLVWTNWQKFNGEQANPGDSTSFVIPQMVSTAGTGYAQNTLHDYLGIPIKVPGLSHSSLFHRAYNLIYNEWFRDQNLQSSVQVDKGDGPDTVGNYVLLRRGKRHDYFTSCLPFPQKGTAVSLPLGLTAPVVGTGDLIPSWRFGSSPGLVRNLGSNTVGNDLAASVGNVPTNVGFEGSGKWEDTKLVANLAGATAATINQIREAFQIQRMFEKDARGGTRYTEIIRSHFGVVSPDARLQRPEFLGGGSARMNINPVAYTTNPDVLTNIRAGDLGAFGTMSDYDNGFVKSFTEHGMILGLVAVRADLNYQQGLPKMFSRVSRFEHYWPSFAHLGEQAVLNKEIFAQGSAAAAVDAATFGFQERYAEYRYKPSMVTGTFRSDATTPLDTWHLAQDFASVPALNATFIVENAPFSRVLAVTTEPQFFGDFWFEFVCARIMPMFGVPGLIDHF